MKNFRLSPKYATNMGERLRREALLPEDERNPFIEQFQEFNKTAKFNPATTYMWSQFDEYCYDYKGETGSEYDDTFYDFTMVVNGIFNQLMSTDGVVTEEVWYDVTYEGNRFAIMYLTDTDIWLVREVTK